MTPSQTKCRFDIVQVGMAHPAIHPIEAHTN